MSKPSIQIILIRNPCNKFCFDAPLSKFTTYFALLNCVSAIIISKELFDVEENLYILAHTAENRSSGATHSRSFDQIPFVELCSERLVQFRHTCSMKSFRSKISHIHHLEIALLINIKIYTKRVGTLLATFSVLLLSTLLSSP